MVRVIAGEARGRKLKTNPEETTKPTLDRVKEAMFSMLLPYLSGATVLDLFAGNGALGIEAISRGAKYCVFNDYSKDCCKIIRENLQNLGFIDRAEIKTKDFGELISEEAGRKREFDLVLLDPPYGRGLVTEALRLLGEKLPQNPMVAMCEHGAEEELPQEIGGFVKEKEKRYGTVGLTIYVKR